MSRVGKKPIEIPEGAEIKLEDNQVKVKGPKGELSMRIAPELSVLIENTTARVIPKAQTKRTKALWGLTRSLLANMVEGVTKGFEKKLEVIGVGYKAQIQGERLVLEVGFSHPVVVEPVAGISFSVDKNIITVSGIDKQLVGNVAAKIRKIRKPDSYKGKGIRYLGEEVKLKPGKKASGAQ